MIFQLALLRTTLDYAHMVSHILSYHCIVFHGPPQSVYTGRSHEDTGRGSTTGGGIPETLGCQANSLWFIICSIVCVFALQFPVALLINVTAALWPHPFAASRSRVQLVRKLCMAI